MSDLKHLPLKRYWGGILALSAVVFIWVSSSFVMNSIFGEMNYNKPFLVTYINTATFSLYLVPILFKRLRHDYCRKNQQLQQQRLSMSQNNEITKLLRDHHRSIETTDYSAVLISESNDTSSPSINNNKLSTCDTIKLSLAFCILWFFANYTTNASLAYTTVGSSTILASMSGLFTLGIGAIFKVEKLNLVKIFAVLVSLCGASLVSYSDQLAGDNADPQLADQSHFTSLPAPLIGDTLALLGAIFYGCYTTLLKFKIGDEDRIDLPLFFGFVGAFNVLLLWPAIPILDYIGIETFEIPTNPTLWCVVLLNAFVGTFLSDYLWLLAMLMTSPLVVTLGISLTIPLALIGDICFHGFVPGLEYSLGAVLVILGFLAVNSDAVREASKEKQKEVLSQDTLAT